CIYYLKFCFLQFANISCFFIQIFQKVPEPTLRDPSRDDPYLPESTPLVYRGFEVHEGLGRLPSSLSSVSSLLLFNSTENPYKKYVSIDTLEKKIVEKVEPEADPGLQITEAPASLVDGVQ